MQNVKDLSQELLDIALGSAPTRGEAIAALMVAAATIADADLGERALPWFSSCMADTLRELAELRQARAGGIQ
jgi:hypothetical protein